MENARRGLVATCGDFAAPIRHPAILLDLLFWRTMLSESLSAQDHVKAGLFAITR